VFQTKPEVKRKLATILPFGFIWLVMGLMFLFVEYAATAVIDKQYLIPESVINLSPKVLVFASVSVFFIGCFVGFLEVYFINKFFKSYTFFQKIFGKLFIYLTLFLILNFCFYMLAASIEMNQSFFSKQVYNRFVVYFYTITSASTLAQLSFSLIISLIYAEIQDNLGQAVFRNFFTGKYHSPKEELRVFMFTDMKDSTMLAEKMGHSQYFDFLSAYYNQLSKPIVCSYGEVYQYIGDEVVISWNAKRPDAAIKSLQCYFEMKSALANEKEWFQKIYGFAPDFRAAIHIGQVTTGEIGALKKEIFFTVDVLNTTSRIQSLCKTYKSDLLVSSEFARELPDVDHYKRTDIGHIQLKGKEEAIGICAIKSK
jgi:adenylate cyclase